jgi:predicted transcriptional regulator
MAEKANMAVKLDPGMRERLRALGEAKRRSPHWLMVEAIRLYVEREEEIERAREETRERLARYDATGEYIADEDVEAWLKTWGTKSEQPPPVRSRKVRTR